MDKKAEQSAADVAFSIFFSKKKREDSIEKKRDVIKSLFELVFNKGLTNTDVCRQVDLKHSTGKVNKI